MDLSPAMWISAVVPLTLACSACGGRLGADRAPGSGLPDAQSTDAAAPCDGDGWRRFDAQGLFEFRAPCTFEGGASDGIDSSVGAYQAAGIAAAYDYGAFFVNFDGWEAHQSFTKVATTLDGRPAFLLTAHDLAPAYGYPYLVAVVVPAVDAHGTKLSFWGSADSPERRALLTQVLKSVRFG